MHEIQIFLYVYIWSVIKNPHSRFLINLSLPPWKIVGEKNIKVIDVRNDSRLRFFEEG